MITREIETEQEMHSLAAEVARCCREQALIFLQGPLGAGKTTFVRGYLRQLGYTGTVKSPTYTLVEPYVLNLNCREHTFYHFDLYRIQEPVELEGIGLRDYLAPGPVCLVEWPERAAELLGVADLRVQIEHAQYRDGRKIHISAGTEKGREILENLDSP